MAITVIGGTITSTLLSLLAVPVTYTLIDDAILAISRLFRRKSALNVTSGAVTMTDVENVQKNNVKAASGAGVRQQKWWRRW